MNVLRFSPFFSDEMLGIWNSSMGIPASCRATRSGCSLLRVQLDDELLLHGSDDLVTVRQAEDLRGQRIVIGLEPGRDRGGELRCVTDGGLRTGARLDGDDVARSHLVRRDVDPAAVDRP